MQLDSRAIQTPRQSSLATGPLIWAGVFGLLDLGTIGLVIGAKFAGLIGYYSIPTNSMAPAIPTNAHVLVGRFSFLLGSPQRGDIVVYTSSRISVQPGIKYVKRVVGIPGDNLEWKPDQLLINDRAPSEYLPVLQCFDHLPYVPGLQYLNFDHKHLVVPAGEYFLLGDNVHNSLDSRFHGPVLKSDVIGKVLFIFK